MKKTVIELFAGVGGFRVGFNNIKKIDKNGKAIENGPFKFVWANQWEPSTKSQPAFDCYNIRFKNENNSNIDITKILKRDIPDHSILCGGFPCQDYSVARSLKNSKGIEGKKGVLWWQINDILKIKKSPFLLLENVDRLIKSPSYQRGRDFGIMLRSLSDLGYSVEWRVINASDYGHPQKRKRIYIFAYKHSTTYFKKQKDFSPLKIFIKEGLFAKTFPIQSIVEKNIKGIDINKKFKDLVSVSDNFNTTFENSGYMINGIIYTVKSLPILKSPITLEEIIEKNVDKHYFLTSQEKIKFKYLRGSKKIPRIDKNGHKYIYSEGAMSPYDILSKPGRTMLTSEGTTNRSTHIIMQNNKLRKLTPLECERLNQFPDNWTNTGMAERKRYFIMGNALVCGVINKISIQLAEIIDKEN